MTNQPNELSDIPRVVSAYEGRLLQLDDQTMQVAKARQQALAALCCAAGIEIEELQPTEADQAAIWCQTVQHQSMITVRGRYRGLQVWISVLDSGKMFSCFVVRNRTIQDYWRFNRRHFEHLITSLDRCLKASANQSL